MDELFDAVSERDRTQRALDDLFDLARRYRSTKEYQELVRFVTHFRSYSPFNALLVHLQMHGATFVAPARRWERDYRRRVKLGVRPLVILRPKGPVMFVFDVADTEAMDDAPPLPRSVTHPFEPHRGVLGGELERTIANAKRDGVLVVEEHAGSQGAGRIRTAAPGRKVSFIARQGPPPEVELVPLRYELLVNDGLSKEGQYGTLVHELAHLYCGHLGTPNKSWWPDRNGLSHDVEEFEAESVCYLVCERLGIENPSAAYLSAYVASVPDTPPISLDAIVRAASLIERMGRDRLGKRRKSEDE